MLEALHCLSQRVPKQLHLPAQGTSHQRRQASMNILIAAAARIKSACGVINPQEITVNNREQAEEFVMMPNHGHDHAQVPPTCRGLD